MATFLIFTIGIVIMSMHGLAQDDATKVEPVGEESDHSDEPGDIDLNGDESANNEFNSEEVEASQERALPPRPNIECTTYTYAGNKQREDAISGKYELHLREQTLNEISGSS